MRAPIEPDRHTIPIYAHRVHVVLADCAAIPMRSPRGAS